MIKQLSYLPIQPTPAAVATATKIAQRCYDCHVMATFDDLLRPETKTYGMQAVDTKTGKPLGVMVYSKYRWFIRLHVLCVAVGQRNQQIGSKLLSCLTDSRLSWQGQRFIYHKVPTKYEIGCEFLLARGFVIERVETGSGTFLHLRYQLQIEGK